MLGKLFKYEFKNTCKIMLTIYAVVAAVTLLGSLVLSSSFVQKSTSLNSLADSLLSSVILLYVLSVFALFVVTYIYMCVHFFKSMYSDQGYLTHTLPVSPIATFHVKLVTSFIWTFCSLAITFLSIFILLIGASRGEIFTASANLFAMKEEFAAVMGMSLGQFIWLLVIFMVFSCLSYLLMVFASASIGQLFHQYKIVASIVAGIVIYFLQQIVGTIVMLVTGYRFLDSLTLAANFTFADIFLSPLMFSGMVVSLLFLIAFYIICIVIVNKHINLD